MNKLKKGDYVKLREDTLSSCLEQGRVYRVTKIVSQETGAVDVLPASPRNTEEAERQITTFDHRLVHASTKEIGQEKGHITSETIDNDLIDKQEHYTTNGIQPIQIMKANMTKEAYRGFLEGNILKYPLRYKRKNGLEDLKKAKTYLTWLIEDIEERGL